MDLREILNKLQNKSVTNTEKGKEFEKFCKAYLKTDPAFANELEEVWLWDEFPFKDSTDIGIDLVGKTKEGEFWAIQSKFYNSDHTISKKDVDTFISASGRAFYDKENEKHYYTRRLFFSTTDHWNNNAKKIIEGQNPPITRIGIKQLEESGIDWDQFNLDNYDKLILKPKHDLKDHQKEAVQRAHDYYIDKKNIRGKLIMSCGTGKTFTSLAIVRDQLHDNGTVLFLAPSISLISQSLREWISESPTRIYPIVICSDNKASKAAEEISSVDLVHPATTNPETVLKQYEAIKNKKGLKVFFSTYQSIGVIEEFQKLSNTIFDFIICDEAHRTTGSTAIEEQGSYYLTVHDNNRIPALKRMYMTATPRIYGESSKNKAKENQIFISSMDDINIYGTDIYHLGFAESIKRGLLTDYKVQIIAVDEKFIDSKMRSLFLNSDQELNIDDLTKIYGIWMGLSKKSHDPNEYANDPDIMKRGIIYTNKIKDSQKIQNLFSHIVNEYEEDNDGLAKVEIHHIDGTMGAFERSKEIDWLRENTEEEKCRILTNARCLAEGVDVPALDSVAFANPKASIIDIIQSVGRVMRLDPNGNKKYGYVIIPVAIPSEGDPNKILNNNDYQIIWNVLRALRAHDERLNAKINRLALEKSNSKITKQNIQNSGEDGPFIGVDIFGSDSVIETQLQMNLGVLQEWKDAIYAKLVLKLGDKKYWESWAKDVADISNRHIMRIKNLLEEKDQEVTNEFNQFLKSLQINLNNTITQEDAIEMISQHLITKPVFEALFEGYEFTKSNPVSLAMDKVLLVLEKHSFETETEDLKPFYSSVRERINGITTLEGKQRVIVELYENFFKLAFKKQSEKLGIVYTPTEVVDFIINSIEFLLQKEFGKSLGDEGVEILDPFTGTGTFITRLLSSGIIPKEKLTYKYKNEINANELVLLAYYIASINIEETFHTIMQKENYESFEGIVLTDTFQIYENDNAHQRSEESALQENSERIRKQKEKPIQIILGNPPYSSGQNSQNDNNENVSYPKLEEQIKNTYVKNTSSKTKNYLYDSYIKAFRWASDRIPSEGGIIGFVSNGSFIDGKSASGFRKCLVDEFTDIYVFNLRGDQRTQGELSRKEGGKIFGSGSRNLIALTFLVKNPNKPNKGQIHYYDIGDYLSRDEKLKILKEKNNIENINWSLINPDVNNDWINLRNPEFDSYVPIANLKTDKNDITPSIFYKRYSTGYVTGRDYWVTNYNLSNLKMNVINLIDYYNNSIIDWMNYKSRNNLIKVTKDDYKEFINHNSQNVDWTDNLVNRGFREKNLYLDNTSFRKTTYRPFVKRFVYFNKDLNQSDYSQHNIYPNDKENISIQLSGISSKKDFSCLISNEVPNLDRIEKGQTFSLFWYDKPTPMEMELNNLNPGELIRRDSISDWYLKKIRSVYDDNLITKKDIFFYIYGILHSSEYRKKFAADLKKSLPRIPFVKDFWNYSKAGKRLADIHLNYENIDPYPLKETNYSIIEREDLYKVKKMKFPLKNKVKDKSQIIYNKYITLSGIPEKAYRYIVNGRSAIEWIMDQYKVMTDTKFGITIDPNDWSQEVGNEKYIIDLIKKIVNVSIQTVDIVDSLPPLEIIEA